MKVFEILEALSPEMEERKKKDQEKIRVARDMSTRAKGSRLRGKRRGTGSKLDIKAPGNM